ncbi:restriction endonuclease subunit S [Streptomyces sp. WG5]|uniref:restriction endonuclease subunit S n=1 Tax=Streptomyces sp. WG5 TaxID=3417648 RepID=UPI003CF7950C
MTLGLSVAAGDGPQGPDGPEAPAGGTSGELPAGWARATLGELGVEAQPGFASGKHNRDGDGIVHLRPMNITRNGAIDLSDARYVNDDSDRRVEYGDVLFNNTNSPALVGKTAWVDSVEPVAYSNHMTRLRGPEGLDSKFLAIQLHWLWASGYFKTVLNNHVNQASVARKALLATEIVVPPLSEQLRIVAEVEQQVVRIEAGESSVRITEKRIVDLVQAIRTEALWPADSESIPDGWYWGTVDDVLEGIEAGRSFTCLPRPAESDEWGVIKVSAMTWGEFRPEENKALPPERDPNPDYEVQSGDILVSRANTVDYVGAPVLVGPTRGKLLLSDKSLRLVPKSSVDPNWLIHVLSSPPVRAYYSESATGTSDSMRNISQKVVRSARIPIPQSNTVRKEITQEINDRIALVEEFRALLVEHEERSSNLRASLLKAAFTGALVPQGPDDEPASALLDRIRAEQQAKSPRKRAARKPRPAPPGQEELPS